jgi:3-oxoacyl-[acyl-carrier protein] reductase
LFLSFFVILQNIKVNNNGYIFYISSSIIKEPGDGLIISSTLRSAMSSLLKSLSIKNSKKNISIINIAPGPFKTRRVKELVKNIKKMEKKLPTGKIGDPKEIGLFVKFILKNNIKYISGSTVYFDGNLNKSYL